MNATKIFHIVLLVLTAVAGLGTVVAPFSDVVPPNVFHGISAAIAFAGTLVAYAQKPVLVDLLKTAFGITLTCLALALVVAPSTACNPLTPAQSAQVQSDVQVAVNTIAPLACTLVTLADPTQASTICSIVDTAGNIVTTLAPVVLPLATAQAVVTAHPATPAVAAVHAAKFGKRP